MTVAELIAKLQEFKPTAEVIMDDGRGMSSVVNAAQCLGPGPETQKMEDGIYVLISSAEGLL